MWGLEKNHMIESRKARYNYGIAKTPEYDPHEGGRRSSRTDSILGLHESTSIKWLLRKVCKIPHFDSWLEVMTNGISG
jgi:hypothetical protein